MNTGSTAGAGSGEFHVYRHNKRREETRLEFLEKQKQVDEKKELFDLRMQTAQREAEEKTSKNRKKGTIKQLCVFHPRSYLRAPFLLLTR